MTMRNWLLPITDEERAGGRNRVRRRKAAPRKAMVAPEDDGQGSLF